MATLNKPDIRPDRIITSDFRLALEAMDFPASRAELAQQARARRYSDDVIELIEHLPEKRYESLSELMSGVSREDIEEAGKPLPPAR